MQKKKFLPLLLLSMLLVVIFVAGCSNSTGQVVQDKSAEQAEQDSSIEQVEQGKEEKKVEITEVSQASPFAAYKAVPVNISPSVDSYQVAPGLENVINREMFEFSPEAEELLIKNGFVVVPSEMPEFFMLYEINLYEPIPSFITTDSMLHNYHLFFSHLLRVIEKEKLVPELQELTKAMLSASQKQYSLLKGSDWENAAKRNLGFFAVAGKLLDPQMIIPEEVKEEVEAELSLISEHSGIYISPLMNMGQDLSVLDAFQEDYSQYIPRGHYTTDEQLEAYFKAMMWYGRMTFRSANEDETKSAVLITLALSEGDNEQRWDKIYQPTNFFVGKADDLSYIEYREPLVKIYGREIELGELTSNNDKWKEFMEAVNELEAPIINSIPIFIEEIQPDREKSTKGFRFMGQRYTLDADIFQRLIYREVKENSRGEYRMLPRALDIPAALGSHEAYCILEAEGETEYKGYVDNMVKLRKYIAGLKQETWTQNLYWGWLYTLESLLPERRQGYPAFMQNQAWKLKELNTFLSSWTELKHDTILYAEQVYAEMGGGMEGIDDRGYVEPNPQLYGRLAALVEMTREGLASRELLNDRDRDSLERLERLALALKTISEKELTNTPLTDEEYDLIRSYGGQLEHFWLEALADMGVDHRSAVYRNPAALVADVATDPNGRVLEEATGYIFDIYAVVPVDGSLRIAKGGVYSHYEFAWPLSDRLTDEKWHEMLSSGRVPPLAQWTESYLAP